MRKVGMHADVKACKNDENKKELTRFRKENKQLPINGALGFSFGCLS